MTGSVVLAERGARDPFGLTGRVALVTGAAGGIGLATAEVLATAGARVVLTDVAGALVGDRAAALSGRGLECTAHVLDVADRAAVDALVERVVDTHGRLDVLVNNAAVIDDATPLEVTDAELDRVHRVNFRGVVACSQSAARVMLRAGSGSIVTVTSGVLDLGSPTVAAYASAKAAAAQYSRGLAVQLAPHGIRVNMVSPGWTETPMNERHYRAADGTIDPGRRTAYVSARAAATPLGVSPQPADQARAVLYLASDAARCMSGTVVRVNSGQTMPW